MKKFIIILVISLILVIALISASWVMIQATDWLVKVLPFSETISNVCVGFLWFVFIVVLGWLGVRKN